MRLFVAVSPSEPAVEDLDAFLTPRREAGPELRWTLPDQWHLTLAFLGETPQRKLDELSERLTRAATRRTAFTARVEAGGAFPGVARAKVLYADVRSSDPEELRRVATGARAAAAKSGCPVDGGRFRPHLTLGRFARPVDATRWVRLLDSYEGPEWPVEEIHLVESHLGQGPRGRPRHETLAVFAFGRRLAP